LIFVGWLAACGKVEPVDVDGAAGTDASSSQADASTTQADASWGQADAAPCQGWTQAL